MIVKNTIIIVLIILTGKIVLSQSITELPTLMIPDSTIYRRTHNYKIKGDYNNEYEAIFDISFVFYKKFI